MGLTVAGTLNITVGVGKAEMKRYW